MNNDSTWAAMLIVSNSDNCIVSCGLIPSGDPGTALKATENIPPNTRPVLGLYRTGVFSPWVYGGAKR